MKDQDRRALMEEGERVVRLLGEAGETGPEVLAIMAGRSHDLFWLLDEKPGMSHWNGYRGLAGEWHYKLRRVRNSTVYGPQLFAGLKG